MVHQHEGELSIQLRVCSCRVIDRHSAGCRLTQQTATHQKRERRRHLDGHHVVARPQQAPDVELHRQAGVLAVADSPAVEPAVERRRDALEYQERPAVSGASATRVRVRVRVVVRVRLWVRVRFRVRVSVKVRVGGKAGV